MAAWIRSHHLELHWKFKSWAGKFSWGVKAKHCWVTSTNFLFSKICWQHPAMFALLPQVIFPAYNLNFHWRWRWWDRIKTFFVNFFFFRKKDCMFLAYTLIHGKESESSLAETIKIYIQYLTIAIFFELIYT